MEDSSQIKDQIVKNSFWNIISSIINRVGGFLLIILLSRLLMPEGFGKYSLAMTISLFFITFSDLGINQTLIRYVSLEIDKNPKKANAYFKYLFKIRFLLTLAISLILFLGAYPLSFYIFKNPDLFFLLIILSFYVFFISLTGFLESLFFIKKNVKYISIKESISLILKILAIILIGYFVSTNLHLTYIFISFVIISFLAFFMNLYFSRKKYPALFRKITHSINKKDISKFILLLNIQNISLMVLSQISIILLGIFLAEKYVGYYSASWAFVTGIVSLLFSFSYLFLPIFTSLKEGEFQHILKKIFRLFFILALPISFGLSLLSKFFITAIYGYDYLPASVSLSVLAFIIPYIIGIDLSLASFSARNKQKKFSMIMLFSAAISILLNYISIKFSLIFSEELVMMGISIANLMTWLFCFLCTAYLLKKEFHVNILSSYIIKSIISCFVMSTFIFFSLNFLKDINLFFGILIIFSSAIIYFISMFLIRGIKKEDISLIKGIFNKKNY